MGKKGRCVNIDCDNYKKDIDIDTGAELECPLCHQPLKPVEENKKKKSSKMVVCSILLATTVLGAGVWGLKSAISGDAPKKDSISVTTKGLSEVKDSVNNKMTKNQPAENTAGTTAPKQQTAPQPQKRTSPQNGRGTVNLGYATYTGDLKNGKPHGYGVLTYKKTHKIIASKDFVANAGDTFEGDFREGKISGMGYWKHDGNMTVVKP